MKKILLAFLVFLLLFASVFPTYAVAAKKPAAASVGVSAKQIKIRNTVRASFSGLKGVSKVSYMLMYSANGIGQGAGGSFSPGKKTSITRDIYLGTCSGRVCTPHRNIKNLQLEVTVKYTNGKSFKKIYKVK